MLEKLTKSVTGISGQNVGRLPQCRACDHQRPRAARGGREGDPASRQLGGSKELVTEGCHTGNTPSVPG